MNPTRTACALTLAITLSAVGCNRDNHAPRVEGTVAGVEVLHAGVTVTSAANVPERPRAMARVEAHGTVSTDANGRAVIRTDDGLEIRVAGDTLVRFADGHPRLDHGRAFVSSWGDDERPFEIGPQIALSLGDAALEAERSPDDNVRVIAIRGEASWRQQSRQGRLEQGEALQGQGTPSVHPAPVWDDWTGGAASPQGAAHRPAMGAGLALLHMDNGDAPAQLAVNEHRVTVRVDGDMAATTVSQRFFNGADRAAPVEYHVRLPEGAIVSSFVVERDGARLTGTPGTVASVQNNGGVSALLAAPDGGLYARLDPLAPGQTVRCELKYVQWLAHDGGRRTYVYPMGDPIDAPFIGEFTFELTTHRAGATVMRGPAGSVVQSDTLRYARSDFRPRGDLAVDLFDARSTDGAIARMWRAPADDAQHAEYVLVDANIPPPADTGTDIVLVVDDSAGTDSGMLSVSRSAIDALLHVLGPNDRVALMFGDLHAHAADGSAGELAAPSSDRREAILDAVARVRPGGATDLAAMLAEAYARLDSSRNGAVLYLGDAMPTTGPLDADRVYEETLRVAPDLRLFAIALGPSAHPEVLDRLTHRGGLSVRAGDAAEAVAGAYRIAAHATRPVYRDVAIRFGAGLAHPLPETLETWVSGDPLRVTGELVGAEPEAVTIDARTPSGVRHWTAPLAIETIADDGDIRRRWGLARLEALDANGANSAALADLGVRFGLITRTSAFVLGNGTVAADTSGFAVLGSLWPDEGLATVLPRLGVNDDLEPRGVHEMGDDDEYPMITDDLSGWPRHATNEGSGITGMLGYALDAASADAQACVDRARRIRPALAGDVTVSATVSATGSVTAATVTSSSLGDAGAESCIRRAVAGLSLPQPSIFGETPGTVSHTFSFPAAWVSPHARACPPSSRLSRSGRVVLWRERIAASPGNLVDAWNQAMWRCELRVWEDRATLLSLMTRVTSDPQQLVPVRAMLEKEAQIYLDQQVARRYGASRVWQAYYGPRSILNWDTLVRRLADPALAIDRKIELAQAYRLLAPADIDVRLRLMSLFEQAGRVREARHVGAELRAEPQSDARVRELVGEMLIRTGDAVEGRRALSEIAEFAPYDTDARQRLGDLLLTYGGTQWADEAYLQYQTLAELRPSDPLPRVRMALAASRAGREDEALRLLRGVAEDTGGDPSLPGVEAMLAMEVSHLEAARGGDEAVQAWVRIARGLGVARDGAVVTTWTHPDVAITLRATQPGADGYTTVGDLGSALPVRVFAPGPTLDGTHLVVRADAGLSRVRNVTAHIALLVPAPGGTRVLERDVHLTPDAPYVALLVQNGSIAEDTTVVPSVERAVPAVDWY